AADQPRRACVSAIERTADESPSQANLFVPSVGTPSTAYSYYALFVLVLIFVLNWMDRMVLSILLVPIQQELQLSDTAMGLLSGFGFSALYALATLWIARYSDRHNRRNLVSWAVAIWSVATSLCGVVTGFWQLLLGRAVVGVAEAGGGAPTYSLI